jgi:hypothetical protein
MTTIVSQASISGREAGMSVSELSPNGMLDEYLLKQEPIFKNLVDLREKVILFQETTRGIKTN